MGKRSRQLPETPLIVFFDAHGRFRSQRPERAQRVRKGKGKVGRRQNSSGVRGCMLVAGRRSPQPRRRSRQSAPLPSPALSLTPPLLALVLLSGVQSENTAPPCRQ